MNIIKPGIVPEPAWPVGHEFECNVCGCAFVIEQGDTYVVATKKRPDGENWFLIDCPTCKFGQKFDR